MYNRGYQKMTEMTEITGVTMITLMTRMISLTRMTEMTYCSKVSYQSRLISCMMGSATQLSLHAMRIVYYQNH